MSEAITLEIDFLGGISYASDPRNRARTEWPPHPDRVFQSLVASWGRNEPQDAQETAALEWLEAQDYSALQIDAAQGADRDNVIVFVPPNDARTTSATSKETARVLPEMRKNRQQRFFPARVLGDGDAARVRYVWANADGASTHAPALARLAREVTYVGHSASLVRASVTASAGPGAEPRRHAPEARVLRVPYRGRLAELQRAYTAQRPPTPSTVVIETAKITDEPLPQGVYDADDAIVLIDAGGWRPSMDAFPLVAKRMRDALLASARGAGIAIPELVSGHTLDGGVSRRNNLAILPLADVGGPFSDGALKAIALIFPHDRDPDENGRAIAIIRAFLHAGNTDPAGVLHFGRFGSWTVSPMIRNGLQAYDLRRYTRASTSWATVTPIAVDRHARNEGALYAVIADMLQRAGVPAALIAHPSARVELSEASQFRGAPDSRSVRRALSTDSPYRSKQLLHAKVRLGGKFAGPLLVGAGRHRGLGLMRPLQGGANDGN